MEIQVGRMRQITDLEDIQSLESEFQAKKIFMNHMNCITLSVFDVFLSPSTGFMLSVCVV